MKARNAFLAATGLALGLPLLGWTGLRGFVGVHGFDTPDVKPRLSPGSFFSGRFRRDFEAHWGHVFFGRTELLFAKNGLYELFNAGLFHSGYAGRIIQGRKGQLFEKPYVDVAVADSLPVEDEALLRRTRAALRQFAAAAESLGPDAPRVAFLLAPSKAAVFGDCLPRRYRRLADASRRGEPYATWRKLLGDCGIAFFDASEPPPAADSDADSAAAGNRPELFPYSGTHWTVHWAALAASNVLAAAAPDLTRPVPLAPRLVPHEPVTRDDRDLAGLLNLPLPYRRAPDVYAHPVFAPPAAGRRGKVLVLGDSFGVQVRDALVSSGAFAEEDVRLVYNDTPDAAGFAEAMREADLALFVYSALSLASSRVATTASVLANHLKPLLRPGRRYALGRSPYLGAGDWGEEDGGRVATLAPGAAGAFVLPVPASSLGADSAPALLLFPAEAPDCDVPVEVRTGKGVVFDAVFRAGSADPLRVPLVRRRSRSGPAVRYPSLRVAAGAGCALRLSVVEVEP